MPHYATLPLRAFLNVCTAAGTATAKRGCSGIVRHHIGVPYHAAHCRLKLKLINLILHIGYAVSADCIQYFLCVLCVVITHAVNVAVCFAAT